MPEGKSGNASHRDWIIRNDPTGEALKAYDEAISKKQRKKSRRIVIEEIIQKKTMLIMKKLRM